MTFANVFLKWFWMTLLVLNLLLAIVNITIGAPIKLVALNIGTAILSALFYNSYKRKETNTETRK